MDPYILGGWGNGTWLSAKTGGWGHGLTVIGLPANVVVEWVLLALLVLVLVGTVQSCIGWLYRANKKLESASEEDIMDNRSLRAIRRARDMTDIRNIRRSIRSIRCQ